MFHSPLLGLVKMTGKYIALKMLGAVGAIFSIYRVLFEAIKIEDVIIVVTVALLAVTIAGEFNKAKRKANAAEKKESRVAVELDKQFATLEKRLEDKLGKAVAVT